MSQNPLVSLIILTYNQENYIEEAIEGALSQTYSPLEIVFSDDNSPDSTFEVISKRLENYNGPHKIILNKNVPNLGLVQHVNKLVSEVCTGDYIAFSAGDDISMPARIEESIKFINENTEVVALSTSLIVIDENSDISANQPKEIKNNVIYDLNYFLSDSFKHINGPSRIVSKQVFNFFPPLNSNCPTEDSTYLFRSFLIGKVGLLANKGVKYRVHGNNMSSAAGLKKMNVNAIIQQYYFDLNFAFQNGKLNKSLYYRIKIKIKQIDNQRNNRGVLKRAFLRIEKLLIDIVYKNPTNQ
ncbi:MAG: glycosyltransferase [Crocinitomicaceae bacterium]|nr:glycosyltransferase [Crocinitomicaceae bacterium]